MVETPKGPKCTGRGAHHTEACRKRFDHIEAEEAAAAAARPLAVPKHVLHPSAADEHGAGWPSDVQARATESTAAPSGGATMGDQHPTDQSTSEMHDAPMTGDAS